MKWMRKQMYERMFGWMSRIRWLQGVTFKIFLITSALLVGSAAIIYSVLYFILPSYYKHYKIEQMLKEVTPFVAELQQKAMPEVVNMMEEFGKNHQVAVVLRDAEDRVAYLAVNDVRFGRPDRQGQGAFGSPGIAVRIMKGIPFKAMEERLSNQAFVITKPVVLPATETQYQISVFSPLQPIDEATHMIVRLVPYMLLVIVLISTLSALIYSRIIARPLLRLNKQARRMAQLDFTTTLPAASKDELGELAASLNELGTNLQRSMQKLQEAHIQLQSDVQKERVAEAKRREFMATISHELKTPISAVSGQLEAMIRNIGVYKDRDKYLRQAYQIMKGMENLVHESLDISKLESAGYEHQMLPIDLTALLQRLIAVFIPLCVEQLALHVQLEEQLHVIGDEALLSKAFNNVISNAVYYSERGASIYISASRQDEYILFEVINTGVTIPEDYLPRLFEPFYRLEQSRNRTTGGSGLGLYITKRVLDRHNIAFRLYNHADGVVFAAHIPCG